MRLLLVRDTLLSTSTLGTLSVQSFCQTLEDPDRQLEAQPEQKIAGATAIPRGIYQVRLDWSTRFKKVLPHLIDVPSFEGILIHSGNTPADTAGCILVGKERASVAGEPFITHSRETLEFLMQLLTWVNSRGESVQIEIR